MSNDKIKALIKQHDEILHEIEVDGSDAVIILNLNNKYETIRIPLEDLMVVSNTTLSAEGYKGVQANSVVKSVIEDKVSDGKNKSQNAEHNKKYSPLGSIHDTRNSGKQSQKKTGANLWRNYSQFLSDSSRPLPKEPFQRFLERLRKIMPPQEYELYEKNLELDQYEELFEILFAGEFSYLYSYDLKNRKQVNSLGEKNKAIKNSFSEEDINTNNKYLRAQEVLDNVIKDEFLKGSKVKKICEIGAGEGMPSRYLKQRFSPIEYVNFDINIEQAEELERELEIESMPSDGETLTGLNDGTFDLVFAYNVFTFLPPFKVYSYLKEAKRVINQNGMIVFNAGISDYLTSDRIETFLFNQFPRRMWSYMPRSFIDICFPSDCYDILLEQQAAPKAVEKLFYVIKPKID